MSRMMRAVMVGAVVACFLPLNLAYAAPPEGKGKPEQSQGRGREEAPGQQKREEAAATRDERAEARADNRADRSEARSSGSAAETRVERQHPHQDRQAQAAADRADNATGRIRLASAHGRSGDHGLRGRDAAKAHVDELLKSLNKLEHARWNYNPRDTRGQGNMGKVDMRSPYGFDKDSGREGADRGRPIRESESEVAVPTLNLAELVTVDWQVSDWYYAWLQYLLNYYKSLASVYSSTWWYSWYIALLEDRVANYYTLYTYDSIRVNMDDAINYTLTLGDVPEGFEGNTLSVTTTLTSINDYTNYAWTYNSTTKRWEWVPVHYDAGQVVVSQTQEVAMSDSGTFTYSYDPPGDLAGYTGNYFELAVTVTDPESGASYTITYDRDLYLYRCPYGIVYDQQTGKPIAGAVVTVHNADGSIAALDKAANPNVSNPQTTDATGRYNAKLAIGKKYYLTVKAPGYQDYQSPVFSERWHIVREDVGMTPLAAQPDAAGAAPLSDVQQTQALGELAPRGLGLGSGFISGK